MRFKTSILSLVTPKMVILIALILNVLGWLGFQKPRFFIR